MASQRIVPLHQPQEVRVKLKLTRRGEIEDKFGGDVLNTSFTSRQRKMVFAGFEALQKKKKMLKGHWGDQRAVLTSKGHSGGPK